MIKKKRPVSKKKVAKKKASSAAPAQETPRKKRVSKKAPAKKAPAKKAPAKKAPAKKAASTDEFQTRIVVGPCRIAFQHLDEKDDNDKFSCVLLFPGEAIQVPDTKKTSGTIDGSTKRGGPSIQEVVDHFVNTRFGGMTVGLTLPIKDGDSEEVPSHEKYPDTFQGNYYLNAKSDFRPQVIDTELTDIDPDDVKSEIRAGFWVMASITGFAYPAQGAKSKGNKGVSFQLNSIQKIAEDETFGGMSIPAADEFADDDDYEDAEDIEVDEEEEGEGEDWEEEGEDWEDDGEDWEEEEE